MGFFSWKTKSPATESQVKENDSTPKPEVDESVFVDYSDPNSSQDENKKTVYTISYGTGFPIDMIYSYIVRDFEQKGFDDAMVNPENSYKESGKKLIINELKQLFEQVRLKYRGDLRVIRVHIKNLEEQGLSMQVDQLKAREETYEEHMKKIEDMENKLKQEDESVMSMVFTYERGFLKGLAAKSDIILKGNG